MHFTYRFLNFQVLLLGGSDFTLLGRPILDNSLFRVEGTVIEKKLSYTKLHFRLKKRKNFRRLKCMLICNSKCRYMNELLDY